MDIKLSGRKVSINDELREYVNEKIGGALKGFDIQPMSCDVVLRVDKNRSNPDRKYVEATVFVRDNVVRVETSDSEIHAAIDAAADKLTRQLRKYKTRIIDKRHHGGSAPAASSTDLADLIEPGEDEELVREKYVELTPISLDEALIQIDLIGHDFYMFEDEETGLVNVVYRREDGGYGVIKPRIEELDD